MEDFSSMLLKKREKMGGGKNMNMNILKNMKINIVAEYSINKL